MANFILEYRVKDRPDLNGLWGPFPSRSAADEFARSLGALGAAWGTIHLRDPDEYTFPEE